MRGPLQIFRSRSIKVAMSFRAKIRVAKKAATTGGSAGVCAR